MSTGKAIGLRHVQDITSTSPAIGSREDTDGFGFRGIGIRLEKKIIFFKRLKIFTSINIDYL